MAGGIVKNKFKLNLNNRIARGDRSSEVVLSKLIPYLVVAIVLASPFLDHLESKRYFLGLILIFGSMPASFLIEKYADLEKIEAYHSLNGLVTIMIGTIVLPTVYVTSVVVAAAALVFISPFIGKLNYLLTFFIAGLVATVGIWNGFENWPLVTIGLLAGVIPIIKDAGWNARMYENSVDKFNLITESSSGFLWEFDVSKNTFEINEGHSHDLLGMTSQEMTNILAENRALAELIKSALENVFKQRTVRICNARGQLVWYKMAAKSRTRSDGSILVYGFAFDVSEMELARRDSDIRAETDSLTGLPNREGLVKFLRHNNALGNNRQVFVSIMIIDIDRFKEINDTLGHLAGDTVIKSLANRFSKDIPSNVCVARLGGDEYAVAIVGNDESVYSRGLTTAKQLIAKTAAPITAENIELTTSVSLGLANDVGEKWTELLRRANVAMYEAKKTNSEIKIYENDNTVLIKNRLVRHTELARNLETQIELWFQPIIDCKSGLTTRLEGLARWNHPQDGILAPKEFLDIIESSGLTNRFDSHILSLASKTLSKVPNLGISINLSAASLWSTKIRNQLLQLQKGDRSKLTIEVTERGLLDDHRKIIPAFENLSKMGLELAIDDYGTGTSSLKRLRNLPLDELKIDRTFVSEITSDQTNKSIVKSSLILASDLGLRTIAEGVETREQADLLISWNCDFLQGYLFSTAKPLEQLIAERYIARPTIHPQNQELSA